jgi:hypothetical protein
MAEQRIGIQSGAAVGAGLGRQGDDLAKKGGDSLALKL